jgi:hypothetical protein
VSVISILQKKPRAETQFVEDILSSIRSGRLRIPSWQRVFNWQAEDVRKLFESICLGYPIGNLLFWERDELAPDQVTFGEVQIHAPPRTDAWQVVDGQQRLKSLAGVLLRPASAPAEQEEPQGAPSMFELYFDLERRVFVHPSAGQAAGAIPSSWMPLNIVADTIELLGWLGEYRGPKEHKSLATGVAKAIREYRVPVYIVETTDESILRDIFDRLNTQGKPLKDSEVFKALSPDGSIGRMARVFEVERFGVPGDDVLVKLPLGVEGLDITRRASDGFRAVKNIDEVVSRVERALVPVIQLIRDEAKIPHFELLPYRVPLHILARFFTLYPQPSESSRARLVQWLWRGAALEAYQGNYVTRVRHAVARMPEDDELGAVEHLWSEFSRQSLPAIRLEDYDFRKAHSKLGVLALSHLKPRHLGTGEPLHVPDLLNDEPAKLVTMIIRSPSRGAGADQLSQLANRLIHPLRPGEAALSLLKSASGDDLLASHGISPEAFAALQEQEYGRFLEIRAADLKALVQGVVAKQGGWEPDDGE